MHDILSYSDAQEVTLGPGMWGFFITYLVYVEKSNFCKDGQISLLLEMLGKFLNHPANQNAPGYFRTPPLTCLKQKACGTFKKTNYGFERGVWKTLSMHGHNSWCQNVTDIKK